MAGVSSAQKLLDDQELMRLLLAKYTLKECAALLGVAYPTACAKARRPEFLAQLRDLDKDLYAEVDHELRVVHGALTQRIVELSSNALDRLEQLLNDENTDERLVAKIAMDFLDRNAETSRSTKSFEKKEISFANPLVLAAAANAAREMDQSTAGPLLESTN